MTFVTKRSGISIRPMVHREAYCLERIREPLTVIELTRSLKTANSDGNSHDKCRRSALVRHCQLEIFETNRHLLTLPVYSSYLTNFSPSKPG